MVWSLHVHNIIEIHLVYEWSLGMNELSMYLCQKYDHTWHRMSLLRPGVIKQPKHNFCQLSLFQVHYGQKRCRERFHHSGGFIEKHHWSMFRKQFIVCMLYRLKGQSLGDFVTLLIVVIHITTYSWLMLWLGPVHNTSIMLIMCNSINNFNP